MNALLQVPVLQRLGLTLLHALWELALVALVAWVGLALLRHRGARLRYAFAGTALGAMVALPLATWCLLPAAPAVGSSELTVLGTFAVPAIEGGWAQTAHRLGASLLPAAPWFALLWSLGCAWMLARLAGGLWWLDHAYVRSARPVSTELQARLDQLARRMGLRTSVRLLESGKADSPLLVGWLKPAILVPTAALLQLDPILLEAVLAHELAHVRRADYVMNLVQSLAEVLLFFHPCAWWLSRTIRELREHCCDDAAAELCGDPLILAQGLSMLERLRRPFPPDPQPALAAARGNLMSRITRLFQPQHAAVQPLQGLALALAGAVLFGAVTLSAQGAPSAKKAPAPKPAPAAPVSQDGVTDLDFSRIKVRHQPPAPAYPREAKEKKLQGTVVLSITLDEQGLPELVEATEGPAELRPTAIDYAKAWRFHPVKVKGKAVKARFKLTMPFKLK